MSTPRKTQIAVIREEYVAITEKFEQALILNQFIYWTERVRDFDQFILEENKRKDDHGLQEEMQAPTHGWIYKTAKQLSQELMTGWSPATTGRHLKALLELGFIEVRQNPKYKWNQTRQYRVDLNLVQSALHEKGYTLPGFTIGKTANFKSKSSNFQNENSEIQFENSSITEIKNKDYDNIPAPTSDPVEPMQEKETSSSFDEFELISILAGLINLIPKQHQKPIVSETINKALVTHGEDYVRLAIRYTVEKSKGETVQKFKAFLGKCIDNNWHKGWEPDSDQGTGIDMKSVRIRFKQMSEKRLKQLADAGNQIAIDELARRKK